MRGKIRRGKASDRSDRSGLECDGRPARLGARDVRKRQQAEQAVRTPYASRGAARATGGAFGGVRGLEEKLAPTHVGGYAERLGWRARAGGAFGRL